MLSDVETHRPARQHNYVGERIEQSLLVSCRYDFECLVVLITSALLVVLKFLAVESMLSQYIRNRVVREKV